MKTRYLSIILLIATMILPACGISPSHEPAIPFPTTGPTPTETPAPSQTQSPNPFAAFADLNAILYSDLIPNPPPFENGAVPWTPDRNIYIMDVVDDGQNNYVFLCNFPKGAANDGLINDLDYPNGLQVTMTRCYAAAFRPSSGKVESNYYIIEKTDLSGKVLPKVVLDQIGISHTLDVINASPSDYKDLMSDCREGVCIEPNAHVLEGSLNAPQP